MDRRREPRFNTKQIARVTLLGDHPVVITGAVINLSGRGMRLKLATRMALGAPIRVDLNGSMLLGEVCYVEPEGDKFATGLVLEQVLHGIADLHPLMAALQRDESEVPLPAA